MKGNGEASFSLAPCSLEDFSMGLEHVFAFGEDPFLLASSAALSFSASRILRSNESMVEGGRLLLPLQVEVVDTLRVCRLTPSSLMTQTESPSPSPYHEKKHSTFRLRALTNFNLIYISSKLFNIS